jgi:DNA-binding transcriptional MerR regulator
VRASEAAGLAGVSVKALRYYEECGLLRPTRRSNGYRDYSQEDLRLVSEIRMLAALGLTAQETRPFLECLRAGHEIGDDCPESLAAYQDKIDALDGLIDHVTRTRDALVRQMHTAARRGFRCQPTKECCRTRLMMMMKPSLWLTT